MDLIIWLLGIVGSAVLGFVIREILERVRDWWVERKNSIRGTYATLTRGSAFRGPQDHAPTGGIERALRLGQRGKRISAIETGADEHNIRWELSGEVNGEFIVGTYKQTSPPSIVDRGAFHLERDHHDPRVYRGLWVGWNPERRQLTSGEYEWTRQS